MTQENRGLFLMLPDCLLDDDTLSEKCIIGFARLMRYCQQNRTNVFTGSFKKLARVTKMPKSTVYSFLPTWIQRDLVTQSIDEDGIMTLTLQLTRLWERNVLYCLAKYPKLSRAEQLQTMPYNDYLQTPEWQEKRKKALKRAEWKCQLCNAKSDLHVHHRTYERRGHEEDGDLTVLCSYCHAKFHDKLDVAEEVRS